MNNSRANDIFKYSFDLSSSPTKKHHFRNRHDTSFTPNLSTPNLNSVSSFTPQNNRTSYVWKRIAKSNLNRSQEEEMQSLIEKGSPALQFLECIKEERSIECASSKTKEKVRNSENQMRAGEEFERFLEECPRQNTKLKIKISPAKKLSFLEPIREETSERLRVKRGEEDCRLTDVKSKLNQQNRSKERKSSIGREVEASRSQENKYRKSLRENGLAIRPHSKDRERFELVEASQFCHLPSKIEKSWRGSRRSSYDMVQPEKKEQTTAPFAERIEKNQYYRRTRSPVKKNFAGSPIQGLPNESPVNKSVPPKLKMQKWCFQKNRMDYREIPSNRVGKDTGRSRESKQEYNKVSSISRNSEDKENKCTNRTRTIEDERRESQGRKTTLRSRGSSGSPSNRKMAPLVESRVQSKYLNNEIITRNRENQEVSSFKKIPKIGKLEGSSKRVKEQENWPTFSKPSVSTDDFTITRATFAGRSSEDSVNIRAISPNPLIQKEEPYSKNIFPNVTIMKKPPQPKVSKRVEEPSAESPEPSRTKSSKKLHALCTPQTKVFAGSSNKKESNIEQFSISSHPSDSLSEKFYIKKKDIVSISEIYEEPRKLNYDERISVERKKTIEEGIVWKREAVGGLKELAERSEAARKINLKKAGQVSRINCGVSVASGSKGNEREEKDNGREEVQKMKRRGSTTATTTINNSISDIVIN